MFQRTILDFNGTAMTIIDKLKNKGFEICERPSISLSRAAIMKLKPTHTA
jgi:hypothetical protein